MGVFGGVIEGVGGAQGPAGPEGPAGGSGDVVGPGAATDNAFVRFDSTTGKLIQDGAVTGDDAGVVSGVTQLNVDNLRLDGNTLSAVSGDLTLTPAALGANILAIKTEVVDSLYLYATSTSGDQRHYLTPTAHQLSSSVALVWYNDPDISSGTPDAGLKRVSAGVIQPTNGTTGFGQLKCDGATGAGTALLATNSPAADPTTPFTWLKFKGPDGSQVYVPAWK